MDPPTGSAVDEVELCRRAARGDRAALGELLELGRAAVWPLCYRGAAGRIADAEDLLQETFYRAVRGIEGYDAARPFSGWLLGIAARVVVDRYRGGLAHFYRGLVPLSDEHAVEADLNDLPAVGIGRVLDRVDGLTRTLLLLRYAEGLGREEISRLTGLSTESVKKRLVRGLAYLRILLEGSAQ